MENNQKISYQQAESYNILKEVFLEKVKQMKGSIPEGFDNDIFLSSFIKIYEYLTKKYKSLKIQSNDIPDAERFEKRDEYTVAQFIFNRIINNIDKVNVENNNSEKQTCGGRYNAYDRVLEIFPTNISKATQYEFQKYKTLNFASEQDFNRIVTEYFIIHELVHAISFDEFSIGFRTSEESIQINEGFTDSLALEISGFGKFFEYVPKQMGNDLYYMIPKNSISSYTIETNIADLIRIVSSTDLTIPYLLCGEKVKWANINRFFDKLCYPLEKNQDVYGYLQKELHVIAKSSLSEDEKVKKFQNLQGCLLNDIIKNKYNDKFLDLIKNKKITYEQAVQYDQDFVIILNKIAMSFSQETAKDIIVFGVQSLEIWDLEKLKSKITKGQIEDTENVRNYIKILEMRCEIQKNIANQKQEDLTV